MLNYLPKNSSVGCIAILLHKCVRSKHCKCISCNYIMYTANDIHQFVY